MARRSSAPLPLTLEDVIAFYGCRERDTMINLRLRVPPFMRDMLQREAERRERSFNSEVVYRLALSLKSEK